MFPKLCDDLVSLVVSHVEKCSECQKGLADLLKFPMLRKFIPPELTQIQTGGSHGENKKG